jgi:radical SAM superfamily enzyme YgiQ (UPF0313 family)
MYKRVAIVTFPSQELERPPAAPAVMGGICKSMNVEYDVFDLNLQLAKTLSEEDFQEASDYWRTAHDRLLPQAVFEQFDLTIDRIIESGYDLVAISVFSKFSTRAAKLFCERFKPMSKTMLVGGGQGMTTPWGVQKFGQWLKSQCLLDHVAWGDGEIIWQHWLQGNFEVPGSNELPPVQIDDLESLPYADFSKLNPWKYFYNQTPGVYITASRGCVRKCTFCDVPARWPKYKYRTGVNIAQEMLSHWRTANVNLFQFTDSVINGNLKEFRSLNESIIELKQANPGFDPRWLSQFNIRKAKDMPEVFYQLMSASGGKMLITGVEHASWDVRKHMGKEFDDADLDHHIRMCGKYGIQNVFLMFIGYPTETAEDHQQQINFLYRYQKYMQAGTIALIRWGYTGSIDHGSRLELRDLGIDFVPEWPDLNLGHLEDQEQDWVYGRNWINLNNPKLTLAERLRRRLEVHELSAKLGYPITKGKEELKILKIIAEQLLSKTTKSVSRSVLISAEEH